MVRAVVARDRLCRRAGDHSAGPAGKRRGSRQDRGTHNTPGARPAGSTGLAVDSDVDQRSMALFNAMLDTVMTEQSECGEEEDSSESLGAALLREFYRLMGAQLWQATANRLWSRAEPERMQQKREAPSYAAQARLPIRLRLATPLRGCNQAIGNPAASSGGLSSGTGASLPSWPRRDVLAAWRAPGAQEERLLIGNCIVNAS